jgi:membrane-associated phospholipid phosphatase
MWAVNPPTALTSHVNRDTTDAMNPNQAPAAEESLPFTAQAPGRPADARESIAATLTLVAGSLNRPYPVSLPMVALVSLVPLYIFIASSVTGRTAYVPESALDRLVPLQPAWALVYGALYMFLIVLPVLVVREPEHIRRTVLAYLLVWTSAYVVFLVVPTVAPRPDIASEQGYGAWGLRLLYSADPPYNCFPSLHVAHSFVSALACHRVHRRVGVVAVVAAVLVAMSTLFTKQHYVADVVGGVGLALVAHAAFLRSAPRERVSDLDRRLAPVFAAGTLGMTCVGVLGSWVSYLLI